MTDQPDLLDPMGRRNPHRRHAPFIHYSAPPVAPDWPLLPESVPPCPHCGAEVLEAPQFQVNLVGPRQIAEGQPPVEMVDVVHLCPKCNIRSYRRYQVPPQ